MLFVLPNIVLNILEVLFLDVTSKIRKVHRALDKSCFEIVNTGDQAATQYKNYFMLVEQYVHNKGRVFFEIRNTVFVPWVVVTPSS